MNLRSVPEVGTVFGLRIVVTALRVFGRRFTALLLWFVSGYYVLASRTARRASASS